MPDLVALKQGAAAAQEEAPPTHAAPAIVRFSLEPLSALKELSVKDMRGGVVHLGRYVLLTVVSDPVKLKGVCQPLYRTGRAPIAA
jgi:hypothetical protein